MRRTLIRTPKDLKTLRMAKNRLGIDIGYSLTKLAWHENDNLCLELFPTNDFLKSIEDILESLSFNINQINFTGGKGFEPFSEYSKFYDVRLLDEFECNIKGIEFLYYIQKGKNLPNCLIVTLGTGTSILLKKKDFAHVGGSTLGGGFVLGLIGLIFDIWNHDEIIRLAKKGQRFNVDLKVSDIYSLKDNRITGIFREFTAATLGKLAKSFDIKNVKNEDIICSIINMVGENIGSLTIQFANNYDVHDIVYSGGFMIKNSILKNTFKNICVLNKKKSIFLKHAELAGAIGALIS
ncbi:MAG: hypothetical protein ACTSRH_09530 [Promethearchaeota archaeon]